MITSEFRTTDLALASTLFYFNMNLLDVEPYSPEQTHRKVFVFEDTELLRETTRKYDSKDLLVEPQAFHLSIKELKARIYAMVS